MFKCLIFASFVSVALTLTLSNDSTVNSQSTSFRSGLNPVPQPALGSSIGPFGSSGSFNRLLGSSSGALGYPSNSLGGLTLPFGSPGSFGNNFGNPSLPVGTSNNFGSPFIQNRPLGATSGSFGFPSGSSGPFTGQKFPQNNFGQPFGPSTGLFGLSNNFGNPNLSNGALGPLNGSFLQQAGNVGSPFVPPGGPFNNFGQPLGVNTPLGFSNNFGIPNGSLTSPNENSGPFGGFTGILNPFNQPLAPSPGQFGFSKDNLPNGQFGGINGSLGNPNGGLGTSNGPILPINSFGQPFGSANVPLGFSNPFGINSFGNNIGSLGYPNNGNLGNSFGNSGPFNNIGSPFTYPGLANVPHYPSNGFFGQSTGSLGNIGGTFGTSGFPYNTIGTSSVLAYGPNGVPIRSPNGLGSSGHYQDTLKNNRDFSKDGSYSFEYETTDGTIRKEQGIPIGPNGAVAMRGSYSFTFPDGTRGQVNYIADEKGFRVVPPVPQNTPPNALAQIEKAKREHEETLNLGNPLVGSPFVKTSHPRLQTERSPSLRKDVKP